MTSTWVQSTPSLQYWVGFKKETTPGTPDTSSRFYLPVDMGAIPEPKRVYITASENVGVAAEVTDKQAAVVAYEFKAKGQIRPSSLPLLAGQILGSLSGTVNGTEASATDWVGALANVPNTYTMVSNIFNVADKTEVYAATLMTDLKISWDAEKDVSWDASWIMLFKSFLAGAVPTPSFTSGETIIPGRKISVAMDTTPSTITNKGDISLKRAHKPIYVCGGSTDEGVGYQYAKLGIDGQLTMIASSAVYESFYIPDYHAATIGYTGDIIGSGTVPRAFQLSFPRGFVETPLRNNSAPYVSMQMNLDGVYDATTSTNFGMTATNTIAAY